MPSITAELAGPLKDCLHLRRAVETGTFKGDGARRLAKLFPEVVTIELSEELHELAARNLADLPNVTSIRGHSVDHLAALANAQKPTLWFLDGHYSTGITAGERDPCPVLREIASLRDGSESDAVVVDDLRMFLVSPEPPQDPTAWPTLIEVTDALRDAKPTHYITVVNDQVIAVPPGARPVVDSYAKSPTVTVLPLPVALGQVARALKHRSFRRIGRMA